MSLTQHEPEATHFEQEDEGFPRRVTRRGQVEELSGEVRAHFQTGEVAAVSTVMAVVVGEQRQVEPLWPSPREAVMSPDLPSALLSPTLTITTHNTAHSPMSQK